MDSMLLCSSPGILKLISSCGSLNGFAQNRNYYLVSSNGLSSLHPRRSSIVAAAKRQSNGKKDDSHSFVPRPDEAIGPFPEVVLLKKKKVEEDGRLLHEFADVDERELFEALMLDLESDLDVERMRHYEVVYLIHEDNKDEVESVNTKVQDFIKEKKGRIWRLSDWGMRRLAYKIQKAKNAHYMLMNFELEAKWINDFKSILDKDKRVIRHLVMKKDKAETEDCPPPPEFRTLSSGMDDDDEEEDLEYDDEYDGEDFEDESEIKMATYSDNIEGIVYVDEDIDDEEHQSKQQNDIGSAMRRKKKAEMFLR